MCGTAGESRVAQSLNVAYAGPAVAVEYALLLAREGVGCDRHRLSGERGQLVGDGAAERGRLAREWIGYETPEEAAVRNAPAEWIASPDAKALAVEKGKEQRFAFRATVTLDKPVRQAALFATGQDTVSAWVNGTQVLEAQPLPPYGADAVEEICARGCDGADRDRAPTRSRLRRCITWSIRTEWRPKMRRR